MIRQRWTLSALMAGLLVGAMALTATAAGAAPAGSGAAPRSAAGPTPAAQVSEAVAGCSSSALTQVKPGHVAGVTYGVTSKVTAAGLTPGVRYWVITGSHPYSGEDIYPDLRATASAEGTISATMSSAGFDWDKGKYGVAATMHWFLYSVSTPEPISVLGLDTLGTPLATGSVSISIMPCNVLKDAAGYRSGIVSPDGRSSLTMQSDGNLVLRQKGKAVWWTSTQTRSGNYATVQSDGNFVVRSAGGAALWNSRTGSAAISSSASATNTLTLYNNGNLILRTTQGGGNRALWQTFTGNLR
ncbi:D-mannose binding lectin [Nakamurella panacisegetis]|uniref:D-mannose binding lectin n=1 Tax=Nakamurella panacisegetis TaxID=1090615 RepID=A0A1H0PGD0_9ACTN|nr:hypothetical protein [Nakamurella panacisegetis]SDP04044.1 D-mannose binding lectin [Nakamurella panacisegetis]